MEGKKWLKQYGVHIAVCAVIFMIAFGINQKINLDRSRIYSVSEGIYTLLKGVTKAEINDGQLKIAGWGFDTEIYNESSYCELILQNTETGEALWPKMEKNSEVVEIAERYTDGGDYSRASFKGSLESSELGTDSVYEILIRYTTDYVDENGNEQQYVRTVSTDEFFHQGEITEYNPKTFIAPEIVGTALEKELDEARLFHYFAEGMWVYYDEANLYYVARSENIDSSKNLWLPCFWYVRNVEDLPEDRREYESGLLSYPITANEVTYANLVGYRVWKVKLPSENINMLATGLYDNDIKEWLYEHKEQLGEITHE